MHNDIMATSSKDRLPMLAAGRYAQWQSHFMRYVDTKPNSKELKKCILHDLYVMTKVTVPAQPATENTPAIPAHKVPETFKNITLENHAHFDVEAEEIHMILSGIRDDIYSTVDACTTAQEMWFLQKLLPEWSRFVTVVKQTKDLDKESYHKLFDILKRYQNEFNEIQAEKLARNTNPLALVATTQQNKNVDTSTRHRNDNQSGQFRNQRTVAVVEARETVWNQEEKGVPLSAEQGEWLNDNDEEPDEQEMEAHYMYMEKIQEVLTTKSWPTFDTEPLEHVQFNDDYNVFAIERQHSEQPETINDTYVVEMVDSNVTLDSSDICDNEGKANQNAKEYEDECAVLANLIANLKLDHDKNKRSLKQLKKVNTSLAHELKECKSTFEESNSTRDRCISVLHYQEIELEKYTSYKDCTIEKEKVERKLSKTLSLLAQQEIDSKEALKTKGHENFLVKEKNAKLVKQGFLEYTRYEGLLKEKDKLIHDFKIKEEKDIDKLIALEKQVKFLNDIIYKRNHSIQTIHMLAPNLSLSYNGRPSFANLKYLKKAQSEKLCLYQIPYDKADLANIFAPYRKETPTLEQDSRSKLDK
ncbi:hypothetical protein Tco_1287657 [Tanacetum coccineum]